MFCRRFHVSKGQKQPERVGPPGVTYCHEAERHPHYMHEPFLWFSSFPPAWQLQHQLPLPNLSAIPPLYNLSCPSDVLISNPIHPSVSPKMYFPHLQAIHLKRPCGPSLSLLILAFCLCI